MRIEIFSALQGLNKHAIHECVCVVIDVLRASSTILCLMENGAEEVKVVGSVEEALELKPQGYILVGERGDQALEGFNFDNSPYAVSQHKWQGKKVLITTTNGTRALVAVKHGYRVVVAGFRNLDAVAEYTKKPLRPVAIIPIGNMDEPRVEDERCAQALRSRILGETIDWEEIRQEILSKREDTIKRKGEMYKRDVELSLTLNTTRIIPVLDTGIVLHKQEGVSSTSTVG